jgi:hypothetical protein
MMEIIIMNRIKSKNPPDFTSGRHLQLPGSGGRTRTYDLWVMSPTSYQLLHPALYLGFSNIQLLNQDTIYPVKIRSAKI